MPHGAHLGHRVGGTRQLVGRRAKGIGADNAAACRRILGVDGLNQGGIFQVQGLGLGAQGQACRLQHGAHGAIQQDGAGGGKKFFSSHRLRLSFGIRIYRAGHSGHSPPVCR